MFDFPSSPTVGAVYTPANGPTYMWDGTTWNIVAGTGFVPGVIKISEGITVATVPNVEIALPTAGYQSFELHGNGLVPTGTAAGAYSACLQFSVGGVWQTGASAYATMWDQIMATASASAGWTAGSNTALAYGFVFPYGYLDQTWSHFKLTMPCVANDKMIANWMVDSIGYGNGWSRARSAGVLVSQYGVVPDKMRIYFASSNVKAGFKWQLNGIK